MELFGEEEVGSLKIKDVKQDNDDHNLATKTVLEELVVSANVATSSSEVTSEHRLMKMEEKENIGAGCPCS